MNLHSVLVLVAMVSLAPLGLYVIRPRQDPFNPLIFIGGMAFGLTAFKLLRDPGPAFDYVTAGELKAFLYVVVASLLALYAGWFAWKWRNRSLRVLVATPANVYRGQYDPGRLLVVGTVYGFVALVAFSLTHRQYHASGYLRDMTYLGEPAVLLLIQASMLDGTMVWAAIPGILAGATRSVWLFFSYGSRGQTCEVAVLAMAAYFFKGKRPPKVPLLALGCALAITMATLQKTRALLGEGYATSRIGALVLAGKDMVEGVHHRYGPGREFLMGAAMVRAVQNLDNWDYGGVIWNVASTFPPHEWFPHKIRWQTAWGNGPSGYLYSIHTGADFPATPGCTATGFADAFVQCAWAFPLFWFLLGYLLHYFYAGGVYGKRLDLQGYMVIFFIVLLYLVAQGLSPGIYIAMFSMFPLFLAYKWCRLATPESAVRRTAAALATR